MPTKSFLQLLLIVSITFFNVQLKAQDKNNPITIDGLDADWAGKVFVVDSADGFEYASLKVEDHLFLMIRFIQKTSQIKSLTTGMQVGFDMYQKNKPQQFIYFPLDNSTKVNPAEHMADLNTMQYALLMVTTEYELKKFNNGNGTYLKDAENPAGIKLALGINDEEKLFYEYSIPLETLRNKKDPAGLTSNQIEIEMYIPAINISSPSPNGNESASFSTKFGAKSSKSNNRSSASPGPNNDIKSHFKEMFESTKKKFKITI
jgi:hypothetical protein